MFDTTGASSTGGVAATVVGGAAGAAATGTGAASMASAGAATGAAAIGAATDARTGARAAGAAALAGRATVAARRVVVDLVAFVSVIVGAGAGGSLAVVESGSLEIVTVGALSGTAVAGAAVAAWVASAAVWARSWFEDSARTVAIAVVARRSWGVLWVMIKVNEYETTMAPS